MQSLSRRAATLGALALVACAHEGEYDAESPFAALEAELGGGRLGVAARDAATGLELEWRADERFAMASTFKWTLAAAILARVEAGELGLADPVPFTEADLLEYAPVTTARVGEGALSIEELCAASVVVSDNTAANLLLARCGGPAGLTAFLRGRGDAVTRLDRNEPSLNENLQGDPRDTTTPAAMLATMERLLLGDALGPDSRERLIGWMVESTTGLDRLRAGLPPDWRVGDKTGTGANGAVNDLALAWPPGRPPILIACFMSEGSAPSATRIALHAEVGRIVAEAWG
jgi:beta-lactamase class A